MYLSKNNLQNTTFIYTPEIYEGERRKKANYLIPSTRGKKGEGDMERGNIEQIDTVKTLSAKSEREKERKEVERERDKIMKYMHYPADSVLVPSFNSMEEHTVRWNNYA